MKKKKPQIHLSYNEDSFLSKSYIKGINYVILIILLFLFFSSILVYDDISTLKALRYTYLSTLMGVIVGCIISNKIIKDTEFFEWDFTERKKKQRFTVMLYLICITLSITSFITLGIATLEMNHISMKFYLEFTPSFIIVIRIITPIYLFFNSLFCVSLFHSIFKAELLPAYKIQSKPQNWIDEGVEIKDEDEIKEIMNRDFNIRI